MREYIILSYLADIGQHGPCRQVLENVDVRKCLADISKKSEKVKKVVDSFPTGRKKSSRLWPRLWPGRVPSFRKEKGEKT